MGNVWGKLPPSAPYPPIFPKDHEKLSHLKTEFSEARANLGENMLYYVRPVAIDTHEKKGFGFRNNNQNRGGYQIRVKVPINGPGDAESPPAAYAKFPTFNEGEVGSKQAAYVRKLNEPGRVFFLSERRYKRPSKSAAAAEGSGDASQGEGSCDSSRPQTPLAETADPDSLPPPPASAVPLTPVDPDQPNPFSFVSPSAAADVELDPSVRGSPSLPSSASSHSSDGPRSVTSRSLLFRQLSGGPPTAHDVTEGYQPGPLRLDSGGSTRDVTPGAGAGDGAGPAEPALLRLGSSESSVVEGEGAGARDNVRYAGDILMSSEDFLFGHMTAERHVAGDESEGDVAVTRAMEGGDVMQGGTDVAAFGHVTAERDVMPQADDRVAQATADEVPDVTPRLDEGDVTPRDTLVPAGHVAAGRDVEGEAMDGVPFGHVGGGDVTHRPAEDEVPSGHVTTQDHVTRDMTGQDVGRAEEDDAAGDVIHSRHVTAGRDITAAAAEVPAKQDDLGRDVTPQSCVEPQPAEDVAGRDVTRALAEHEVPARDVSVCDASPTVAEPDSDSGSAPGVSGRRVATPDASGRDVTPQSFVEPDPTEDVVGRQERTPDDSPAAAAPGPDSAPELSARHVEPHSDFGSGSAPHGSGRDVTPQPPTVELDSEVLSAPASDVTPTEPVPTVDPPGRDVTPRSSPLEPVIPERMSERETTSQPQPPVEPSGAQPRSRRQHAPSKRLAPISKKR